MLTTYVENIVKVYGQGTFTQIRTGAEWYNDAHALALHIANGDAWKGAGVISAFSPQNRWERNVELATRAFRQGYGTGHTKVQNRAATRIIHGAHPLDILKGDKTRAFAAAIASPWDSEIATIDRHAHDIAMGRVFTDKERKIGKVIFREMSDAYVIAAQELGFSVAQTQAITWVIWREGKAA